MSAMPVWLAFLIGGLVGAGAVALVWRRAQRPPVDPTRSVRSGGDAPPDAPPLRPTAELVGAWVYFLRDHVRDAIGGLNNRLSAVSLQVETLRRRSPDAATREVVENIALEVSRASNITASLMSRVATDAPDRPPPVWRVLQEAPQRAARVLIVDSDESNRTAIARLLRSIGHEVWTASDGREAWDTLERDSVDCIVCDPRLPAVGGRALYEQTAERLPHLLRRFVFVTGDLTDPETHAFLESSGQPVIGKPYELESLLQGIATVLREAGVVRDT